ncbi:sigma 54-interacting transcriptional regulator [Hymenobacter cellulosivorans]|uniref:Sigma 54-interacting transcriptional regulator n=1 Tax=Hymenobacter cellulosivorans TaxID=2932249 RepID=A0ABY4F8J6_9BACT|nr:sigma 54-interacting transcriptional regulator [Hymenobacter cellulosivorans]UOQ52244.1 sigma 54-interacting transcriptional regulator [Hymenobacter cellulosivorans]
MLAPSTELSPAASILIVEDEFVIANNLRRILTQAGYQVPSLAKTVAEARQLIAQNTPDIVLLDIFLRGEETGIDLAQELQEAHIPFVYLSANLSDSVLEAAKVTQPFGFLNKPFRAKDVLTTLEIARYRHAHSEEAKLRRQQQIQVAVNNAIITLHDRDQLSLAIAAQIDKLVPFSFLNLRIALPEEQSFYWVMLRKTALGTFERIHLPVLLGPNASDELLEKLTQETPDQLGEQPGIFTGPDFEALCAEYLTARAIRDTFGVQSLLVLPVVLKRRSFTNLQLARTDAAGFTAAEYEAVRLTTSQIALALDNLLACEEIDERRRLKTAELAVASAFQNGKSMAEIVPAVAAALNELLPGIDLLSIYRVGRAAGSTPSDAVAQKKDGQFRLLPAAEMIPPGTTSPLGWQQILADMEPWLLQPTLNVGRQAAQVRDRNPVTRLYGDQLSLQSSMYVPVFIKGEAVAALVVASKAAYAFTPKDLQTLQSLAAELALALDNLLAFERIKALSEQLEQEKTYLSEEIKTSHNFGEIVGSSPALQSVFTSISQVAPTDYTVLVTGETGTGKELVARALHNLSKRRSRTMVKVNCAALPPQLIESELFGHEKGAFTGAHDRRIGKFELAHGSTIFLDEIGELPLELQAKLLRVLQEKEIERLGGKGPIQVDVRIVAATNRHLQQEVAAGRFRADLYYRLNVFPLLVPPLRERPEDILPLTMHFLQKISKQLGKPLTGLSNAMRRQLEQYSWPGNVRELEHVLERAAIMARTTTLELPEPLVAEPGPCAAAAAPAAVKPMQDAMRETILAALAQANNRIRGRGGAAELLHLKPTTLESRMKKLQINRPGE